MTDLEARLEIYRIWVDTITAAERRRHFVSASYAFLALAPIPVAGALPDVEVIYIAAPVYFVSGLWLATVYSFRCLAMAKFKVIEEMEETLPVAPFREEWRLLQSNPGRLFGLWDYTGLTRLEMACPLALLVLSSVAAGLNYFFGYRLFW